MINWLILLPVFGMAVFVWGLVKGSRRAMVAGIALIVIFSVGGVVEWYLEP